MERKPFPPPRTACIGLWRPKSFSRGVISLSDSYEESYIGMVEFLYGFCCGCWKQGWCVNHHFHGTKLKYGEGVLSLVRKKVKSGHKEERNGLGALLSFARVITLHARHWSYKVVNLIFSIFPPLPSPLHTSHLPFINRELKQLLLN